MQSTLETTATVDSNRRLLLDEDIPAEAPKKVRVIVLFDEDLSESEWRRTLSNNEVFDFLADEGEDIYNLEDGEPFANEK